MAEDYGISFDDFLPVDEYFDMRQLAKKIAETDNLIQNIKALEEENAGLRQKLLDFNESAKQVKTLLDQEKAQTCDLKKNNSQLKDKLKNAEAQVTALQNAKNNLEMINDQHLANYERLLLEEKNSSQGRYAEICQKFANQAKVLSENDLLHGSCKKDFVEVKRYAQFSKLLTIDFDLPKKIIMKPTITSQSTSTDAVERKDAETSCDLPLVTDKKTFVTRATQYMCSTTTRSACTSAFIKKHNVATNFPEVVPISIEQIFRETYLKIPKAIEAIEDLPQEFVKENSTQTRKPSTQTTGTCTVIKNIRRPVYYYYPYIKNNIKTEKKSPASSMLNVNIDHLNEEKVNSTRQSQLSELWSLLGQTIFTLIGEDNQDVNQLQLKDIKNRMGLIKTQLEQNFFEKEEMLSLASPSILTDTCFYEDSGSMDTYNGDDSDSDYMDHHINTEILRECTSTSSNNSTSLKNIEIQNILFDYKVSGDNNLLQNNEINNYINQTTESTAENNCSPFQDRLSNSNNYVDNEHTKGKENNTNLNDNDDNCLIKKSSTAISTQTYNFHTKNDCNTEANKIVGPELEHDEISSTLSQSTSDSSNNGITTLINLEEICQSNELPMNTTLNTKNEHNFKIPLSNLIYDKYRHCKLEKPTEMLEKPIPSSYNNGFTYSKNDENLVRCEEPEENTKLDLTNSSRLNSIPNRLKIENSKRCKKRKVRKQKTDISNRKKFKSNLELGHNLNTKIDLKVEDNKTIKDNFINFNKKTEENVGIEIDKNVDKDLELEKMNECSTEKFDKFLQKILKGYISTTEPIENNIPESKKLDLQNCGTASCTLKEPNEKELLALSDHNYVRTPQNCGNINSVQALGKNIGDDIGSDVLDTVFLEINENIEQYPATISLSELQQSECIIDPDNIGAEEYIITNSHIEKNKIDDTICGISTHNNRNLLVEFKTMDNIYNKKNINDSEENQSNEFHSTESNQSDFDDHESPLSPPFFEIECFGRCPTPVEIPLSTQDINFSPLSPSHIDQNNSVYLERTKIIPLNRQIQENPICSIEKILDSAIGNIIKNYSVKKRQKVSNANLKETSNESKLIRKVRKPIEIYLTHEPTENRISKCVARLLKATKNQKIISKSLIEIIEDTNEDICIKYTPPAPPIPETHQKLITMLEVYNSYVPKFQNILLKYIDKRLFSFSTRATQLTDIISLTQFYLALIDIQKSSDKNPARLFMFKCMYYHKKYAFPMIYRVITCYPNILPPKDDAYYDNSDALISTILCILNSSQYVMEEIDLKHRQLYHILKYHYQYERIKPSKEEVIDNLIAKIRAKRFRQVVYAFVLICKWNGTEWTEKYVIEKHIIPVLSEYLQELDKTDDHDETIAHLIESLSSILKPFPLGTDISRYQTIFVYVLHATQRKILQEAAIGSLIRLSQFGYTDCFNRICHWKPLPGNKINRKLKIDVDDKILQTHSQTAQPLLSDYLSIRDRPLRIDIYHGSIDTSSVCLKDLDAVIGIEIIEHLYPEVIEQVPYNVFGYIQPKLAIFTTPNSEFNVHFRLNTENGFRHPDHKFEWTRQQFKDWCENICTRFPNYKYSIHGIAKAPPDCRNVGCVSQMVVFARKDLLNEPLVQPILLDPDSIGTFDYKLLYSATYPFTIDNRDHITKILDEAKYHIGRFLNMEEKYFNYEKNIFEIPIQHVFDFVCLLVLEIEDLKKILKTNGYKISDTNFLLIEPEEEDMDSMDSMDELDSDLSCCNITNPEVYSDEEMWE